MDILLIIALIVACLSGWFALSLAVALLLGRVIAKAKEEQRLEQCAQRDWAQGDHRQSEHRVRAFTHPGVARATTPPERATLR